MRDWLMYWREQNKLGLNKRETIYINKEKYENVNENTNKETSQPLAPTKDFSQAKAGMPVVE